jgi:hypothetical protein
MDEVVIVDDSVESRDSLGIEVDVSDLVEVYVHQLTIALQKRFFHLIPLPSAQSQV